MTLEHIQEALDRLKVAERSGNPMPIHALCELFDALRLYVRTRYGQHLRWLHDLTKELRQERRR